MDFKATVAVFANRFKEPSSWAGLGALLALFGLHMSVEQVNYLIDIGVGVAGLLAFFLPEKSK